MSDMIEVESSNIAAVGYDEEVKKLLVRFKSGHEYAYDDVPESTFEAFLAAPSKGQFFAAAVRGVYAYEKLA